MFLYIILALAAVVAIVLVIAATRPDTHTIGRSVTIDAPAVAIFPHIIDLRRWEPWSPFEKKDPGVRRAYSGSASGPGAIYDFEGGKNVGIGRVTIVSATEPSAITLHLDMRKPMVAHNIVEFTLAPRGASTEVTWTMHAQCPYMGKLIGLFLNMDRMIGGEFSQGLASLKALVENAAPATPVSGSYRRAS